MNWALTLFSLFLLEMGMNCSNFDRNADGGVEQVGASLRGRGQLNTKKPSSVRATNLALEAAWVLDVVPSL